MRVELPAGWRTESFLMSLMLLFAAGAAGAQPVPKEYRSLGQFKPEVYAIADEAKWTAGDETDALLTMDGRLIAHVASAFRQQLDAGGAARLRDGRIVNLDERVDGQWRYVVVHDAPFGLGAADYRQIPYRTVAVDPKRIRLGRVLYVPALDGIRLPSGELHDGLVFAHEERSQTSGDRPALSIFVGFEDRRENTLTRTGRLKDPIDVYAVDAQTASRATERFKEQFLLRAAAPVPPAAPPAGARLLGQFKATAYRILDEREWPAGNETEALLALDGRLIARVSQAFKTAA